MIYAFGDNDQFFNSLVSYPRSEIFAYNNFVSLNNRKTEGNNLSSSISLEGVNVGASSYIISSSIYEKNGSLISKVAPPTTGSFFKRYFVMTDASSVRDLTFSDTKGQYIANSLASSFSYYHKLSPKFTSSAVFQSNGKTLNASTKFSIIALPSLVYGQKINPGSLSLMIRATGSILAEASDFRKNGEIICTYPSAMSGTVVGLAFYSEGYLLLTSSAAITSNFSENYLMPTSSAGSPSLDNPRWVYFGAYKNTTADSSKNIVTASFHLSFEGVNKIEVATMMAHLPKYDATWSNNASFMSSSYSLTTFSPNYWESETVNSVFNMTNSGITNHSSSFSPHSFVSQVIILDEQKLPIAIACLGRNTQKRSKDQYTIKMQLDL